MTAKTIFINVGNCKQCKQGTRRGEIYDADKRHNCNACGYHQSYNREMLEIDDATGRIVYSTVPPEDA